MHVALYARVSTLNGQNPEMQLAELREYSTRRGWTVTGEYVDEGESGAKESRPALNRLMADAHRRRFAALLVWKIDRFGRSLRHLVNALACLLYTSHPLLRQRPFELRHGAHNLKPVSYTHLDYQHCGGRSGKRHRHADGQLHAGRRELRHVHFRNGNEHGRGDHTGVDHTNGNSDTVPLQPHDRAAIVGDGHGQWRQRQFHACLLYTSRCV